MRWIDQFIELFFPAPKRNDCIFIIPRDHYKSGQIIPLPNGITPNQIYWSPPMRRVIIESPFAGETPEELAANIAYARACCADAWKRGEDPFASHLLYPQFLDDKNAEERKAGIERGYAMWPHAAVIVFYVDRGISNGMKAALARAFELNHPFEKRTIPGYADNRDRTTKA